MERELCRKVCAIISSFLIVKYLYLLFAKDYADSPKIKKKEKKLVMYILLSQ